LYHFEFILCLRICGRIGAPILLSKKNCGIPYSFLPSIDTLTDSYVLKISEVSGFAAEMVCKRKHSKYSLIISSNYIFKGLAFETLGLGAKKPSISLMSSETDLLRNQAIQNQRNSFLRGFPLSFNVETLQAFGALFQIPHYYRKFL
jgi:hypothetical protein